jgi:homoserine kinase type II
MNFTDPTSEIEQILTHFNLGKLVSHQKDERGFVNTSFAIETEDQSVRRKYFLRKYKRGTTLEGLVFEHSIVGHLIECRFTLVPEIFSTRYATSSVKLTPTGDNGVEDFYTIFSFLQGEDRYTWVNPQLTPAEIESAAIVLAKFHGYLTGFTPSGRRSEPPIVDLLPQIRDRVANCHNTSKHTSFTQYLVANQAAILAGIDLIAARVCPENIRQFPHQVIHCDYHPGNLKFQNEEVTGLFDFDWSKIDARLFDLGLALFYFFANWGGEEDGHLRLKDVGCFVRAYQEGLSDNQTLRLLDDGEMSFLPDMIAAGAIYVLNWAIEDHGSKDVDPAEYLVYLNHCANTLMWLNHSQIRLILDQMLRPLAVNEVSIDKDK